MKGLIRERFQLKQTVVSISARKRGHIEAARESIRRERALLEEYISHDRFFMITLDPYDRTLDRAPEIVQRMVQSCSLFGIGPMAAVAGALAQKAVEAMVEGGAEYAVVENGGDIALKTDIPLVVGIYTGDSAIQDLGLEVPPQDKIIGICTSSGTVGPSISFGVADAATVLAEDAFLADAGATALGNAVTPGARLEDCFAAVDRPGVAGALVVRGNEMALWGSLPQLCRAPMRQELITRG